MMVCYIVSPDRGRGEGEYRVEREGNVAVSLDHRRGKRNLDGLLASPD